MPDCYGLPERPRTSLLQSTVAKSPVSSTPTTAPYRIFNIDNYEDQYVNQSLYGSIPMIYGNSLSKPYNAGLLWMNASDSYVDVVRGTAENPSTSVHMISECGQLEFFVFLGRSPLDIATSYGRVTGVGPMPQLFALGYHQCRWDRDTQKDVEFFSEKFDEIRMPCDCLWMDIDHTDDKRYFTWDPVSFPDPTSMLKKLNEKGRHAVVIVDPHIKIDPEYYVYKHAMANSKSCQKYGVELLVMNMDRSPFEGVCWPGASVWMDYLNPKAREYWASLFALDKYKQTTIGTFIWNDMNEPAISGGFEGTAEKNALYPQYAQLIDISTARTTTNIGSCTISTVSSRSQPHMPASASGATSGLSC